MTTKPSASVKTNSKSKEFDMSKQTQENLVETVDLNQLAVPGLKRYKRVFKLQAKSNARPDLANAVNGHFEKQEVDEEKTIYNFMYMIKNKKSKLHNTDH